MSLLLWTLIAIGRTSFDFEGRIDVGDEEMQNLEKNCNPVVFADELLTE
jgi:hypothetical protein